MNRDNAGTRKRPGSPISVDNPAVPAWTEVQLNRLATWLKGAGGIDLQQYKEPYLRRRLATRLRKVHQETPAQYLDYLEHHPEEVDGLISTLTVNVTGFFRNPATFRALQQRVYPELFQGVHPGRPVRIWSLGCSGGEEAYSVALQLQENAAWRGRYSLLGTDVSPQVLQLAETAEYDKAALAPLSEDLRQRYFLEKNGLFTLRPSVKRTVRFRRQDVLGPQRYPRADLVLCRNLLIYFDRRRQAEILQRIAACLSPAGFLVLGCAETLPAASRSLYQTVLAAERIYQRTLGGVSPEALELFWQGDPHARGNSQ